jgi:uncharacterized protein YfkK (UPF0435 family)
MDDNQPLLDRKASELTQTELFARIVYKIRRKYDFQISEMEAIAAARNLIGFTQTLLEIGKHNGSVEP